MRSIKLNAFALLILIGFVFQGCSKDENITTGVNEIVGNDNDNNGNNDGENNNMGATTGNDLVFQWTELMLDLERYAAGMRPNASARALAYIYLASYETAVPTIVGQSSLDDQLQGFRIRENEIPDALNPQIALNACFAKVLDHFLLNVPSNLKLRIGQLESRLENELDNDLSDELIRESKDWGDYVARQVIEYSESDQAAETQVLDPQPRSYEPPTGDGFWTYSDDPERALFPYWESVRTFVISPDQTSTVAPIDYSENSNSAYFAQMTEAYTVNNAAKNGDDEQLWIAEFWSDDVEGLMFSPPARQLSIANQLVKQYDLNLAETLSMYVKLGFSLNDAAVATWKYKYQYMVMRPNVFIHEFIDSDYQTNLYRLIYWPNPSFPGYPSGHSCFASAAAGIFIDYFGSQTSFTDRSHEGRDEFQGAARSFTSFEQMAEENAFSRIPLGVHVRMDCDEGIRLGYEISEAVNQLDLFRNPG